MDLYYEDAFGFHLGLSSTVSCPSPALGTLENKIYLNQNMPLEEKPKKNVPKILKSPKGGENRQTNSKSQHLMYFPNLND